MCLQGLLRALESIAQTPMRPILGRAGESGVLFVEKESERLEEPTGRNIGDPSREDTGVELSDADGVEKSLGSREECIV